MKTSIAFLLLFLSLSKFSYAQQIGTGYAAGLSNTDFNQPLKSGIYEINSFGINPDESHSWQHLFVLRHSNQTNNFQLQFSSSFNENDRIFFRKIANSSNPSWQELATRGANNFVGNQSIIGNVGIGTTNPTAKFEVLNSLNTNDNEIITSITRLGTGTGGSSIVRFGYHSTCDFEVNSGYSNTGHRLGSYFDLNITNNHTGGAHGGINFATNSSVKMAINVNGNVGIGTTIPDAKLAVNGTIHSKEVKVDMSGWPDFVFKKQYDLPTLAEVEKHITEKGHLENIPSEEEVLKNGINLGEMNAKLLQKIEELTLHLIEKDKQLNFLLNENKMTKRDFDEFRKLLLDRLETLEKKTK